MTIRRANAPPANSGFQIMKTFDAGWGTQKTLLIYYTCIIFVLQISHLKNSNAQTNNNIDSVYFENGLSFKVEKINITNQNIRKLGVSTGMGWKGIDIILPINLLYYQPNKFLVTAQHSLVAGQGIKKVEAIDLGIFFNEIQLNSKVPITLTNNFLSRNFVEQYKYKLPIVKSLNLGLYTSYSYSNYTENEDIEAKNEIGVGFNAIYSYMANVKVNDAYYVRGQLISRVVFSLLYYPEVIVRDGDNLNIIFTAKNHYGFKSFIENRRSLLSLGKGNRKGHLNLWTKLGIDYHMRYYDIDTGFQNKLFLNILVGLGLNFL
jgi:hypothetical protein